MASGATTANRRTITAFFDDKAAADRAVERLIREGFPRDSVRLVSGREAGGTAGVSSSSYPQEGGSGFWESLKDLFLPDEDRSLYAEGLRRGGYLVTVSATDAQYERALDILDDDGTVDIDECAERWRREGWTGYQAGSTQTTASAAAGAASLGARTETARTGSDREEAIPIVEERLDVGKREVAGGRVRVRSYVVETPVEEQVNLRQERVEIERRPVDRPVSAADEALFRERTIEAEERVEEPVVNKEARVKEELVVNKDVEQRTETVRDTVRRTEVEVDDERTGAVRSGERNPR
jgi:uncharacterized protein (TIGR02271 family)